MAMAETWVLVFPGQGAQAVGMGKDVAAELPEARALFQRADELLGIPLTKTIFEVAPTALVDTAIQQAGPGAGGPGPVNESRGNRNWPATFCRAAAGLSLG